MIARSLHSRGHLAKRLIDRGDGIFDMHNRAYRSRAAARSPNGVDHFIGRQAVLLGHSQNSISGVWREGGNFFVVSEGQSWVAPIVGEAPAYPRNICQTAIAESGEVQGLCVFLSKAGFAGQDPIGQDPKGSVDVAYNGRAHGGPGAPGVILAELGERVVLA